jgi:hypothetical protein
MQLSLPPAFKRMSALVRNIAKLSSEIDKLSKQIAKLSKKIEILSIKIDGLNIPPTQSISTQLSQPSLLSPVEQQREPSQDDPRILPLNSSLLSTDKIRANSLPPNNPLLLGANRTFDDSGVVAHPNSLLDDFSRAIETGNSGFIRSNKKSELNITKDSAHSLVSREFGHKTQLEEVNEGGSYYRVLEGGRNWLFPSTLTLKTIVKDQPSKGLFRYEIESGSVPHIKQPAEIRFVTDNCWEVIEMGAIIVNE